MKYKIHLSCLFCLVIGLVFSVSPAAAQDTLTPGQPVSRELSGTDKHTYSLTLAAGQFLDLAAQQQGISVQLNLTGPDGKSVAEADSPHGLVSCRLIVAQSGVYQLEVSATLPTPKPGRYELKITELRPATERDATILAAEACSVGASQLMAPGTIASLDLAIAKLQEALALWRIVGDRIGEARELNSIARCYHLTGDREHALEFYRQALEIYRALDNRAAQTMLLNNMSLAYRELGEMRQALQILEEASAVQGRANLLTQLSLGQTYAELGEPQTALSYYQQALQLAKKAQNQPAVVRINIAIGGIYEVFGDDAKALSNYQETLAYLQATQSTVAQPKLFNCIGRIQQRLGARGPALASFNEALAFSRTLRNRPAQAAALDNLGVLFSAEGKNEPALASFNEALALAQATEDKRQEGDILYHRARLERDTGRWETARDTIGEALKIVETLRAKIGAPTLRASYFATVQDYYELALDVTWRLHQKHPDSGYAAQGLATSEQAKARLLLESLAEVRLNLRAGVAPELLQKEKLLQQQLNVTAERLGRLTDKQTAQGEATRKELNDLRHEYEKVLAQMRAANPRYAALTQPQPLTATEIQRDVVDAETVLLEYALGAGQSYLWAVTSEGMAAYELPNRAAVEAAARRAYDLLTARNKSVKFETANEKRVRINQSDKDLPAALADLNQMVLGPAQAYLNKKRWLIVADGALQYIPFGALSTATGHEIVSLPSASALAVARRELAGRRPAPKDIAVIADPVFAANDSRFQTATNHQVAPALVATRRDEVNSIRRSFGEGNEAPPRLPFTRREALAIGALVPKNNSKVALDFAATHAAATSDELANYRIIHFATHGLINTAQPELSGLVFSLVDERGRPQPGFLSTYEIYNLKLPADLVVLSACRTGLGKEIRGEGLVGLTRGFMYAGAARVAVSLWDVNDAATAELMSRFYRKMLGPEKLSPAAALRAAQASMATDKRWAAPYYWAGFILQGEPR